MKINNFEKIVNEFQDRTSSISSELAVQKPADGSWSLKQITGHLIDSAANFHQRLVRLQEGNLENFPTYNGGFWVEKQNYQQEDWDLLRQLWHTLNLHILYVLKNIPESSLKNEWLLEEDLGADLDWLIHDYYEHMEHHIRKFEEKFL